jgi:hypothetical protein
MIEEMAHDRPARWPCGGAGTEQSEHPRAWVLLADVERDRGSRLLRSDDGGASWSESLPLPSGTELAAIAFRTRDRGFGVTPRGEILATSNGGDSWTTVLPPSLVDDDDAAVAIAVSPNGHVVVGGQIALDRTFFAPYPLVMISDDDGATWATLVLETEIGSVRRVCSTNEGDVLAVFAWRVGGSSGGIAHGFAVSRPGERPLSPTGVPATGPRRAAAITCIGERQFWTAGYLQTYPSSPSHSSVWTSRDAALTWEDRGASVPEEARVVDMTFSDP